jgi:hypothetical protein
MGEQDKNQAYGCLVFHRWSCEYCKKARTEAYANLGMQNPSRINDGEYERGQISPWSLWQNSLVAKILIVGQDWGTIDTFKRYEGRDPPATTGIFPTNGRLVELIQILDPDSPINASFSDGYEYNDDNKDHRLFFTNAALCLKGGSDNQKSVDQGILDTCVAKYTRKLIEIIRPGGVIALGQGPTIAISKAFGVYATEISKRFSEVVGRHVPYHLEWVGGQSELFPVYHCGNRGKNNRITTINNQRSLLFGNI